MMQIVSSQKTRECLVSIFTESFRSVPQGCFAISVARVRGCSSIVNFTNIVPSDVIHLECVPVRMTDQSTSRFRFAVTLKLPSNNRQHQELRYSSPKESTYLFLRGSHVQSIAKLKGSGYVHFIKPKLTDSKLRVPMGKVSTSHSVVTKSLLSDKSMFPRVYYQKLSERSY